MYFFCVTKLFLHLRDWKIDSKLICDFQLERFIKKFVISLKHNFPLALGNTEYENIGIIITIKMYSWMWKALRVLLNFKVDNFNIHLGAFFVIYRQSFCNALTYSLVHGAVRDLLWWPSAHQSLERERERKKWILNLMNRPIWWSAA